MCNTVSDAQHKLAFFGPTPTPNPNKHYGGMHASANYAYSVPAGDGWLIYTRFHSCRAHLRAADGWTQGKVDVVLRIIDGEVVL